MDHGNLRTEAPCGSVTVSPGQPTWVRFDGEFDLSTTDELTASFASIPPGDVVLELRNVTFGSSAFLTCLLVLQQRVARSQGQLSTGGLLAGRSTPVRGHQHVWVVRSEPPPST